jgi:hypothetical protein
MPQQEPDQLRIARKLNKLTATGVVVAALALVAATVYAYIAYRQLEQMRSSAIVDQRAGIYPEGTAWGFIGSCNVPEYLKTRLTACDLGRN